MGSRIEPETVDAYRGAQYRVDAGFVLSIDQRSAALAAWQATHGVDCSALVTACNPAGQLADAQHNHLATRALAARIEGASWTSCPATGLDPQGQWPPEPGFLIAGLDLESARSLGRTFKQNAIVWSAADAIPRLILLR